MYNATGEPSNNSRDVRVTARQSVGKLFIAPDLSPVPLLDRELEKGTKGWTDFDKHVEDVSMVDGGREAFLKAEAEAMTVGTFVPKAPRKNAPKVRTPRPTVRRWA
ncbi:hypothetical protein SEA_CHARGERPOWER_101 [Mycobacterium phage Chargerpower]|nr:hypothetical protein SEA_CHARGERPOWER_101 [Mycobacterium phage Chargerpower]